MNIEQIRKVAAHMVIMDVKFDNFYAFRNFHMNMAYPKKILHSYIENEFLEGYPNFRYKKVNIIMGANASGKTSLGKMLMNIFNFLKKKEFSSITHAICNPALSARFSIDFVASDGNRLCRLETSIAPRTGEEYQMSDITASVKIADITQNDRYETCAQRLNRAKNIPAPNYLEELEKLPSLSWFFSYPQDFVGKIPRRILSDSEIYLKILENILKALDPAISGVTRFGDLDGVYAIHLLDDVAILQDGELTNSELLSTGTKSGIDIAALLTSIIEGRNSFYYCDEKFSYIHSDIEKAILSVMIESLQENDQLFFTTHNADLLDLPLPKHSFLFLRKNIANKDCPIDCVSASDWLKRSTDSVKAALDNDLFSTAPATDLIYDILNIKS